MSGLNDPLSYKQYFGQFSGDQDNAREIETYDNIYGEFAAIKGIPIDYYPINVDSYSQNMDPILGENPAPKWDRKYKLTGVLDKFTQELIGYNSFGHINLDEITLYIHRSTFDKLVGIRSIKAPVITPNRRGAFGPVAKDEICTPHNGLIYEVLTGGLHFLDPSMQLFGHKFWYKITCKVRQVSDAPLGQGEQYGVIPNPPLDPKYTGNSQFILPTPPESEMQGTGTPPQSGAPITPSPSACGVEYVTTGAPPGPSDGTVPYDTFLDDGRVADKYEVPGQKPESRGGDADDILVIVDEVFDPQTNLVTTVGSSGYIKYGPTGITIPHDRDLWGDW